MISIIARTKGKGEISIKDLLSGMYITGYGFENHVAGAFQCEEDKLSFEKCRHDGSRTIVVGTVAVGFIAYLIYHWGEEEESIYSGYYNKCLDGYIDIEGKKAGARRRDLRKEFSSNHFNNESKMIYLSQGLYEFVPPELANTIIGYVEEYVNYIPANEEGVPALESLLIGDSDKKRDAIQYIRSKIITRYKGRGAGVELALATKYLYDNRLLKDVFEYKSFHASLCQEFNVKIGYQAYHSAMTTYAKEIQNH
jgi:hypothetical protein